MNEASPLDDLLAVWSSALRLRPAELEEIRQAILADPYGASAHGPTSTSPPTHVSTPASDPTPPPTAPGALPTSWWQTFAVQVAGVVVQANRPPALAGLLGGTVS
ncbi:hypothetical protein ABN034_04850 [Actinopolymorpha sp. B11F2]|uniref:hypothetical protein n=1 Tax=Actinopolymorpha sp. B11F2 TaxID=3160862 RepID=UPI0032E4CBF7